MELIATLQPWHWLVFGIVLLIAEMLGAGGFLIGLSLAAIAQSVIVANFPGHSWDFQLLIYAFNSVLLTVIYWKFFRKFNESTDTPDLNNRAARLVGETVTLSENLPASGGRIQIGDTLWKAKSTTVIEAGKDVKVTGSDGMTIIVEPLDAS